MRVLQQRPHDGKKTLTEAEIDRVLRRFENQWGDTLTDVRILRAVDEVDDTKDDPVALAERVTLPERERATGEPDIFAPSERRDFQDLVAQL